MTLAVLLLSCADVPEEAPLPPPSPVAVDRLRRASLGLRGHPPLPEETRAVHEGADWSTLVRSWRSDPILGEVAADVMAEALGVRHDAQPHVPPRGPLASVSPATLTDRLDEAPLRLIAHIVRAGRPFTAIVTTSEVVADPIVSQAYGPPVDLTDPGWQVTHWPDGRPAAGILVSSTLMQRHPIAPTNHQRSRAAIVMEALLCDDMADRPEAGTVRPLEQDDATWTDPVCLSCHASLDPFAANFEGFRRYILASEVERGYGAGCAIEGGFCYPLDLYASDRRTPDGALPEPGFYGTPTADLAEVGRAIADDPRFATCMVRRFFGHLTGLDQADVEGPFVAELAERFAQGFDVRDLLLDIATHDAFAPDSPHAPPSFLRPRQWARTLAHLVDVRATALPSPDYGSVDLVTTDRYGLNQGMGGVEGWRLVPADRGPLPSRELAWRWLAEEAAAIVLARESVGGGTWFSRGFATDGPEARAQLVDWHLRVLAEVVAPDDPAIDADLELLERLSHDRAARDAWGLLLAAFLQHPRLVVQ